MEKIKLVVIEDHTLGFLIPNTNRAGILHASVLKGAVTTVNPIYVDDKKVRLASEKDFNEFRVSFKGFDNKNEYEYAQPN